VDVPLLDLRHSVDPEGFLDLNHVFMTQSHFADRLAEAMARHGLLRDGRHAPSAAP
jgi:hypothetical protein